MLQITKYFLVLSIITSLSIKANDDENTLPHSDFSQIILHHSDENGFSIEQDSKLVPIQRCYMDKELRGISSDKLERYLTAGAYLSVKKLVDSEDHALHLNGRIEGGGWLTGTVLYYLTKGVGYMAPVFIAGSAVKGLVKAPEPQIREGRLTTPPFKSERETVGEVATWGAPYSARESLNSFSQPTAPGTVVGIPAPNFIPSTINTPAPLLGTPVPTGTLLNVNNITPTMDPLTRNSLQTSYPVGLAGAVTTTTPTLMEGVKNAGLGIGAVGAAGVITGKVMVNVLGQEGANQVVAATITSTTSFTGGYVAAVESTANMAFLAGCSILWLP